MSKIKKHVSISKTLYFISTALLVVGLFYNQILPSWISNTIKIALVLFLTIEIFTNLKKWILIVLSVFMFITSGALFYSQYSFNRLINQEKTETSVISFVVLEESTFTKIEDLKSSNIGFPVQFEDDIANYLEEYLDKEIKDYTPSIAHDDLSNLQSLYNKAIDVMVLDNSMWDSLVEQDPTFESKTKVLFKIEKSFIKDEIVKEVDTAKSSFVILISGVDSRTPGAIKEKARSDVNILMVINPKTHKALTISIPRDTYTPLGCKSGKMDKLTHSGVYGIECTVKTVQKLIGIDINYYVKVNFTAFINVIKALGTINVYSKYAFETITQSVPLKVISFKSGMNIMNSEQALAFVRARYGFSDGDVQRGLNQQEVIKAIVKKVIEPSSLLKIEKIIKATAKSIDTNLTNENIMKLIQNQIQDNKEWEFTTTALTGKGDLQPTYSMGSRLLYVTWPDLKILEELKAQIKMFMEEKPVN